MTRIDEILEPGEKIRLCHWPDWFVFGMGSFLALSDILIVAMLVLLVGEFVEPVSLYTVIALFVAGSGVVLYTYARLLRIAVVTDRRVLRRNGLGWAHPTQLRLADIDLVEKRGSSLVIAGGGREISIRCPPSIAAKIADALGRQSE